MASKMPPRRPRWPSRRLKWPEDAPKTTKNCLKRAYRPARGLQDGPGPPRRPPERPDRVNIIDSP
eukprot:5027759-Pyramimonas_sp.AAC.1